VAGGDVAQQARVDGPAGKSIQIGGDGEVTPAAASYILVARLGHETPRRGFVVLRAADIGRNAVGSGLAHWVVKNAGG
jgi:hypothetical protein